MARFKKKLVRLSGVYKITNTLTGFVYIGKSVDIVVRWDEHIKEGYYEFVDRPLYNDMKEYGYGCFSFQILELVVEADTDILNTMLKQRERFYYNLYREQGTDLYNIYRP